MTDRPEDLTDRQEDEALAAEYVLGLLTPEERRAYEARMEVDPEFRALTAVWTEDLSRLADDIPDVAPPARVQAALMDRLFPEAKQSIWQKLGLLPAMLGGLAAAALVLVFVDLPGLGPVATDPSHVAEIAAEDRSLVLLARLDADAGTLSIDRQAGDARAGRVLELWLIAGDNPPVSLGVLPAAQTAELAVDPSLIPALRSGTLAVSDEPPGGSPTGLPTGDVLALGPVTAA